MPGVDQARDGRVLPQVDFFGAPRSLSAPGRNRDNLIAADHDGGVVDEPGAIPEMAESKDLDRLGLPGGGQQDQSNAETGSGKEAVHKEIL